MSLESILQDISEHKLNKEDGAKFIHHYLNQANHVEKASSLGKSSYSDHKKTATIEKISPTLSDIDTAEDHTNKTMQDILQQQVLDLCKKHLKLRDHQINVATLFSSVGVDSISVSAIMSDINKLYQLNMPVPVFLEYKNIRDFCGYLELIHANKIMDKIGNSLTNPLPSSGRPVSSTNNSDRKVNNDELEEKQHPLEKNSENANSSIESDILMLWERAEQQVEIAEARRNQYNDNESKLNLIKNIPNSFSMLINDEHHNQSEFIVSGSGDKTILFISGLNVLASAWAYQIKALSSEYRVICYHPPGYGNTTIDTTCNRFQDIADRLNVALTRLNITAPIPIVAWSMGGCIAQEYALLNPDKVQSLILVNSSPYASDADIPLSSLVDEIENHQNAFEIKTLMACDDPFNVDVMRYYKKLFSHWSVVDRLQELSCPVHAVAGNKDTYVLPEQSLAIAEQCRSGKTHLLDQAGHFIPLTHYKELNSVIYSALNNSKESENSQDIERVQ